jgi:hypothetical protein
VLLLGLVDGSTSAREHRSIEASKYLWHVGLESVVSRPSEYRRCRWSRHLVCITKIPGKVLGSRTRAVLGARGRGTKRAESVIREVFGVALHTARREMRDTRSGRWIAMAGRGGEVRSEPARLWLQSVELLLTSETVCPAAPLWVL